MKEKAVAFNHQERPTADLLLGERRVVQAGEAGQIRHMIEIDAKGNRTLLQTEVVKEAVTEIVEVGTKVESRVQPLEGPKFLEVKKPSLVVEEEVLAFGREERENANLSAGERRLVQAGVEGLRRNLVEVDSEGKRSLKGTDLVKEVVTEIVEVGTKVVEAPTEKPVVPAQVPQTNKQEVANAEAKHGQAVEKQLPNTGTGVDANLVALGLAGVLSGFGLLAQKKKED
ncbi:G5 domain-containing protein [Streptococcus infantis]